MDDYPDDDRDDRQVVRVNFANPVPLFPLDSVTLLPHQALPLHVFEPRYRQLAEHALDSSGLIAMAIFDGSIWKTEYDGAPPLRPAVCIGHIIQHENLPGDRYNILLQGVCRARIKYEIKPNANRLYREAFLEPIDAGAEPFDGADELLLGDARDRLTDLLSQGPLARLSLSRPVLQQLANESVPTAAVLELVSFALISDTERRYKLLAEPDVIERSAIIFSELSQLGKLIRQADHHRPLHPEQEGQLPGDEDDGWPRGVSLN